MVREPNLGSLQKQQVFFFYFILVRNVFFFLRAEEKIQWLKALGIQTGGPEFGSAPLPQNQDVAR